MKNTGTRYDIKGLIVINILLSIGIVILYSFFDKFSYTWYSFIKIMSEMNISIVFSLFFIGVGLLCDFMFIKEKIAPKKKIVAKLISIERMSESEYIDVDFNFIYILVFKDSKNKNYYFKTNDVDNLKEEKNYNILVKNLNIISVNGVNDINIAINPKKQSYWLTLYLFKDIKFENLFLLPIIYVIFLIFFLNFIMLEWSNKMYLFPAVIVSGYIIINDFYQKKINK